MATLAMFKEISRINKQTKQGKQTMKTIITRIKRLALALCFVTPLVSWAAEPVAVWDGDFSAEALNKFSSAGITLVDWQQTHGGINHGSDPASDYSSVTIDRNNQGVFLDFASARGTVTVLVKYSGIPATPSKKSTLIATTANSNGNYNRCGIRLQTDRKVIGLWNNQTASNNDADYGSASSDALPSSGTLAFVYDSGTSGITVYAASGTDALGDTALWNNTALKAGNIYGMAIGGSCRNSNSAATTGMTISGLAVFSSVLSVSDMNAYIWPSEIETISVTGDTSFSALNALVADSEAKSVVLSLDDGATVMVDEAFAAASVPVVIASEGSITLSAESQPDASYFTNADFSGVKGGLLRSWLTEPGVVGINFCSSVGSDTSGALVNCSNWISDGKGHNDKTGTVTSSALFSDGLSVATWYYANTWSSSSGTLINGYLDDGSKNGNGAEVHISNVPYQTYDVVIYCNSDSNPGNFLAKTVNGTTYTWDSDAGAVVEGSGTWGKAALAIPVYGVNALRIKNLTGPLTIYGTPRSGSSRGCIAAIQIMPPDTPDNIRTYTLTLDGTDTTWSAGTWTLEGNTVDAPTAGNVKIVASASTTVTVDSAVSLATLTVENSTDAVVSLVPSDENCSISTISATVKSGVLKQCAANLVAGTLTVEDGGTFDFGGFAPQANVRIAGDGDGNYPWALTSTGDAPLGNWISLVLDADATVGGTGKITFGKDNTAGTINYNGHTLTKTGSGEFVLYNGRTATDGTGTLDIVGGKVTLSQYTCIDGYETIYAHTAVIVRNGAELSNGTNRGVWIDTLTVESGATVTTGDGTYFGVTTALVTEGALTTTKLQFNDDATVTLGGDLTLTDFVAKGDNDHTTVGDVALVLADGTESATVTVSGTVDAVGTVSVGSGITPVFSGESDVTATLSYAADPSPTVSTALAFTQQDNWKGTVVLDYAITGADGGSVFQPGKYGNANSTVCLGQGATNIFLSVRGSSNFGDIDTKLYFKGDVSLRNGWGTEAKATTIPQLGADEGVTFTTRQGANTSNGTTYYTITSLKDFAGTIALSDLTAVTIGNVEMAALPEKGALVVKAKTGTGNNKGTISGSVTVGSDTVALVFDTVNDVSGLYRPNTVDITIPTVDNATVAVTVGGVAVTPENGVVTVEVGSAVVVTYTAADGYTIANGTIEFTADANTTTVDTTSVTVSEYIAWIYDVNGNLVGNPYTAVFNAVQAFFTTTTGESIRFKTSIEESESDFHKMLLKACNYDDKTFTYTRKPSVAKVTSGIQEYLYTSLVDAVTNTISGATVTLLANVTLEERVEPNLGEETTLTIDLDGYTLTREGTSGNGSVFDVKSGTVTIKNGTIDCKQDDTAIVAYGVYAITARSGSVVTLEDLTITVDSQAGACVYPFDGATVTIKSGTYKNETAEEYQYHTGWTGMAVNQANVTTQLLSIEGGKFWQVNPEEGDDSGNVTNFLAAGRIAKLVEGYWTVSEGAWAAQVGSDKYTSLAEAVAEAESGDTVTLLADVTLDASLAIPAGKSLTLNLNGYTLTGPTGNNYAIANSGNITLTGGTITGYGVARNVADGATITVTDGTYTATGANGFINLTDTVGCAVTINGGTFTAQEAVVATGRSKNSSITVNSGTLTSIDNAVLMDNGSSGYTGNTITVTGGTLNGGITTAGYVACGIYCANDTTVNVTSGTFNITGGCGILARAGKVSVSGTTVINTTGTATGKVGDSRIVVPCAPIVYDSAANYPGYDETTTTFAVSGGTFTANGQDVSCIVQVADEGDATSIAVSGGLFNTPVAKVYCASGYIPCEVTGGYSVKVPSGIDPTDPTSTQEVTVDTSLTAEEQEAAAIAAATVKVPDGVSGVDAPTYKTYFTYSATPTATAGTYAVAITGLADEVTETADGNALAALEAATAGGTLSAEVAVKPGLYYGTVAGADVTTLKAPAGTLNTTGKLDLSGVTKPSTGEAFFIKIKVGATAFAAEE